MIKTHCKTSLKYLCKKSTDKVDECYSYLGSGKYWKDHLKKHGKDIVTEILEVCNTKEELTEKGIYWSKKLNVVKSEDYANLIEERGDGGPTMLGRHLTVEQIKKQKRGLKKWWKNIKQSENEEDRQNRKAKWAKNRADFIYVTPYGKFIGASKAAKAIGLTSSIIRKRCIHNTNVVKYNTYKCCSAADIGKTWLELGWYTETNS